MMVQTSIKSQTSSLGWGRLAIYCSLWMSDLYNSYFECLEKQRRKAHTKNTPMLLLPQSTQISPKIIKTISIFKAATRHSHERYKESLITLPCTLWMSHHTPIPKDKTKTRLSPSTETLISTVQFNWEKILQNKIWDTAITKNSFLLDNHKKSLRTKPKF